MSAASTAEHVVGPADGTSVQLGGLGVRHMLDGLATGGGFSLVEHPIEPHVLAAPPHTHENEDEYSYVLEGEVGLLLGDETILARPGDLVLKPRGIRHAFWNPGDTPSRLLEIISPAGFERYFDEIAELVPPARPEPDIAALAEVQRRWGLTMDFDAIPELLERHGLRFG